MKKITIQEITLRNWRGEKQRTTQFHTDAPTYICGDNGLGKSRHFDAFCWLLFGKDSQDRKDFELRTYDANHNVLHHCECSVEALVSVDDEQHRIKREYKEQWVKPRGQVEEIFKGNVTECTWDDTPVKVGDFQKRVNEVIIEDTIFKMITNPRYFTENMKWQLQRETLLQMAGTASDDEIAQGNPEFKKLLDTLGGKSLSDYRKEMAVEKKRLKADAAEIQPRIDQTQKMMPEAEEWGFIEARIKSIDSKIANLTQQVSDFNAREEAADEAFKKISKEIYSLRLKRQDLDNEQLSKLRAAADEKNNQRKSIEDNLKTANSDLSMLNIDSNRTNERINYLKTAIGQLDKELNTLRDKWRNINALAYEGSETCPHCGQHLPATMIADAKQMFDAKKKADLDNNSSKGKSLASQLKDYQDELQQKQSEQDAIASKLKLKTDEIESLYQQLKNHPAVKVSYDNVEPTEEMLSIDQQIEALAKQQSGMVKEDDGTLKAIEKQRDELSDEKLELVKRLQNKEVIDKANEEIARLELQGRELAQKIADLEKQEYVAAQFSKKKIENCEQRINSMFTMVRFQLFDYTQEGNEFEVCIPLVGGVPYAVANTASQLNAGLDIINTLCRFNNVCAPIFCDGSESVNHYIDTASQMIFLQVTNDKQLVIK